MHKSEMDLGQYDLGQRRRDLADGTTGHSPAAARGGVSPRTQQQHRLVAVRDQVAPERRRATHRAPDARGEAHHAPRARSHAGDAVQRAVHARAVVGPEFARVCCGVLEVLSQKGAGKGREKGAGRSMSRQHVT